jgi:hypothetical protein
MSRLVQWLVATGAPLLAFGLVLWAVHGASFSWLPQAEADRWVVAVGLATVAATVVAAPAIWWAQRDRSSEPDEAGESATGGVQQRARASGHSSITQVGGDQHITGREKP